MKRFLLKATVLLAAGVAVSAAGAETVAITGGKVFTMDAQAKEPVLQTGTVLIQDGKITAVGAQVVVPAGARVIDARGAVVTPGLIAPSSNVGVVEVSGVGTTRNDRPGAQVSPSFDLQYGIDPRSRLIPLLRRVGVTTAVVTPAPSSGSGNDADGEVFDDTAAPSTPAPAALFGGQAAAVSLAAGLDDIVVKPRIGMTLDLGDAGASTAGGARGATFVQLATIFEDTKHYAAHRADHDKGQTRHYVLPRPDMEALLPVIQGQQPLLVRVHSAPDIRQALKFAQQHKLRLILEGAEEAWLVATDIAKAKVPVVVDVSANSPESFETLEASSYNAVRLAAAGVKLAIRGGRDAQFHREARFDAGTAVALGLPYHTALASITSQAAEVWGLADRLGSITVGKQADVVVWNGDPLELTTYPLAVLIRGKEQPLTARHTDLAKRYQQQNSPLPPAYR